MFKLNYFWGFSILLYSLFGFVLGEKIVKEQEVSSVVELNDDNFYQFLTPTSEWVIAFTAKWCGACNSFKSDYERLGEYFNANDPSIRIVRIDIDESPALSNQFIITHLPTLYHFKDSEVRSLSKLPRDTETMKSFLIEKKWKKIEPVHGFFAPFSLLTVFFIMSNLHALVRYFRSLPTTVVLLFPGILIGIGLYYISKTPAVFSGDQNKKYS